jgi:hypothetical protein
VFPGSFGAEESAAFVAVSFDRLNRHEIRRSEPARRAVLIDAFPRIEQRNAPHPPDSLDVTRIS